MKLAADTIYYGGHRHGLEPPTAEQLAHDARIDEILTRILGGVPTGKAPRLAPVIDLAAYRAHKLKFAA